MNRFPSATRLVVAVTASAACASATFAADKVMYFEQNSKTSGIMGQPDSDTTQKVWMSDTAYRLEQGGDGSTTIIDNAAGMIYFIDNKSKQYHEATLDEMKSMAAMGMSMFGGDKKPVSEVSVTDETARIAGHDCYKVLVKVTGPMTTETTMWMGKDVGVDMASWAGLAQSMGVARLLGDAVDKLVALEGFPLKQDAKMTMMGMTMNNVTEVTKIEQIAADSALFTVPESYKKQEGMPGMPGAGATR